MVITQNIDNLHQDSGIPEEKVIELHGNGTFASCLTCDTRYELENIKQSFLGDNQLLICKFCGGIIKTATISFGQAMPLNLYKGLKTQLAIVIYLFALAHRW